MKIFISAVLLALAVTLQATPTPPKYYIRPGFNASVKTAHGKLGPYFQGDMMLTEEEVEERRSDKFSPIKGNPTWPKGIAYYTIDNKFSVSETQIILEGMRWISDVSCVRFLPRTIQPNFIYVTGGDGCASLVGMQKENILNLGDGCLEPGIVAHEFLHAIGFEHEQSRPDRDDWVIYHKDRLEDPKDDNQFEVFRYSDSELYGLGYDFDSIMHYGPYDFGRKGAGPVLEKRKPGPGKMGQTTHLSDNDIKMINKRYQKEC